MRTIKFKIWNGKEMKFPTEIRNFKNCDFAMNYSKDYDSKGNRIRVNVAISSALQFTGLKDKKGIEIYEGDIVDYRCKSQPDKKDLRIVKFHENGFFSATGGYDINLYAIKDAVTVVGNIYENPELLSTPTAVL